MSCYYCGAGTIYRCKVCGKLLCGEHTVLRTMCASCTGKSRPKYAIEKVVSRRERERIRELVEHFWGEEEQLIFDRKFIVATLPAYVAKARDRVIGFISFAEMDREIIIVALGVFPKYQGSGVGKSLLEKVEGEANRTCKSKLLVSTSNDDLPALAFYQSIGFQIFEVKPNVIAEKHGSVLKGIGGLPVRDEIRLRKILT